MDMDGSTIVEEEDGDMSPPPYVFVTNVDALEMGVSNVANTFFSCSSGVPARLSEQDEKVEEAPIPVSVEVAVVGISKNGLIFKSELSMSGVLSEIGVTPPPLPPPPAPPPVGGPLGVTSSDWPPCFLAASMLRRCIVLEGTTRNEM